MLCEECHVNEANFTVSVVTGEETTVRHLCADCMSRMNADLMKGNVRSLLNTVLSAIQASAEERKEFSMPIFGRFTQRAQQTLLLAQRIAAELQQTYVGTEHLLLALLKSGRRKYDGQCILLYFFWYGLGRAWIEGLRSDSLYLFGSNIRVSQALSIALVLITLSILIIQSRRPHSPEKLYVNQTKAAAKEADNSETT